jgi:hypothetical protein
MEGRWKPFSPGGRRWLGEAETDEGALDDYRFAL